MKIKAITGTRLYDFLGYNKYKSTFRTVLEMTGIYTEPFFEAYAIRGNILEDKGTEFIKQFDSKANYEIYKFNNYNEWIKLEEKFKFNDKFLALPDLVVNKNNHISILEFKTYTSTQKNINKFNSQDKFNDALMPVLYQLAMQAYWYKEIDKNDIYNLYVVAIKTDDKLFNHATIGNANLNEVTNYCNEFVVSTDNLNTINYKYDELMNKLNFFEELKKAEILYHDIFINGKFPAYNPVQDQELLDLYGEKLNDLLTNQ